MQPILTIFGPHINDEGCMCIFMYMSLYLNFSFKVHEFSLFSEKILHTSDLPSKVRHRSIYTCYLLLFVGIIVLY